MKSRVALAGAIVAGLMSSATLSVAATGCSPEADEPTGQAPVEDTGVATAVDAAVEEAAASDVGQTDQGDETGGSSPTLQVTVPASTIGGTDTTGVAGEDTSSSAVDAETTTSIGSTSGSDSTTGSTTTALSTTTAPSTTETPTETTAGGSGVVGQRPDGDGNPAGVCLDGVIQPMADDAYCGYADVGGYCLEQINYYRALEGLPPYVRLEEFEACAAREARLALEAGRSHYSDNCGWRSQASSGGGRGGDDSPGTVEKSVWWLPKLIFGEGPEGGHYQGMMADRVRGVACGYFALDRDQHRIIINYYEV